MPMMQKRWETKDASPLVASLAKREMAAKAKDKAKRAAGVKAK